MRGLAVRSRPAALRLVLALAVATVILSIPLFAVPAGAADHTILAYGPGAITQCGGSNYCWAPSSHTIAAGDRVVFDTGSGSHGLQVDSGPWPACPGGGGHLAQCALTTPGTYTYECSIHHSLMTGTITVNAGQPPSPMATHTTPATPPPATHPPAPAPTSQAPAQPPALPSPSPTPEVALAPSPDPSPSPSPTSSPVLATAPAGSRGSGSPLPVVVGLLVVAALGGAAFYWFRMRSAT
ncbi:MAG: Copper binding protein plastocyanin/azurin family [Chloroflexota bacterium]|jgi:plastocyanin|nr:Copper binding protein plastocyanin/azurin family [Chloroflexota bacterium]